MSFYGDSSFALELPENEVQFIGDSVNIKVTWTDDMPENLPLSFYLSECAVSDGENSFKVLADGCPQSLVGTQLQGDRIVFELKCLTLRFILVKTGAQTDENSAMIVKMKEALNQGTYFFFKFIAII